MFWFKEVLEPAQFPPEYIVDDWNDELFAREKTIVDAIINLLTHQIHALWNMIMDLGPSAMENSPVLFRHGATKL